MKRRLAILALTALAVVALFSVVLTVTPPAHAGGPPDPPRGATQISGIGLFDEGGVCVDFEGAGADFANTMGGDLEGCLYVFIEDYVCSPSGTYREWGTETFVGNYNGKAGTFETNYLFTAKLEVCPDLATEIFGRCQHPIVAGSGKDVFEGVTGRLDFKDILEVVPPQYPYRGHLRW
jgi:hypothetical protein